MEDPQGLMHPQSIDGEFGVTVELIEDIDSLDDLADISHVEDVMGLGGSGQEVLSN